jgi:hypothetical protein
MGSHLCLKLRRRPRTVRIVPDQRAVFPIPQRDRPAHQVPYLSAQRAIRLPPTRDGSRSKECDREFPLRGPGCNSIEHLQRPRVKDIRSSRAIGVDRPIVPNALPKGMSIVQHRCGAISSGGWNLICKPIALAQLRPETQPQRPRGAVQNQPQTAALLEDSPPV